MLPEGTPKSTLMLLLLRIFIIVYLYLRNTPHDLLQKKTSLFLGKIVCCTSDSLSPSNNRSIWEWIHDLGFKAPVETRFGIFFGGHNQTWQRKNLYISMEKFIRFFMFHYTKRYPPCAPKKSLWVVSTHPPKKWKSLFILTSIYSHQSGVVWK